MYNRRTKPVLSKPISSFLHNLEEWIETNLLWAESYDKVYGNLVLTNYKNRRGLILP